MFLNNELEKVDITATELMYLGSLYKKDGITQDELVREYCIDKAATARTIQSMEKKGLVYRKADEVDKRAKRVYLTEKGRQLNARIKEIIRDTEIKIMEGISAREQRAAGFILNSMLENLKKIK